MLGTLIFIFLVAALAHRIFYVVDSGHAAVMYRFFWGTDIQNVYREGLHIVFPWNHLIIYEVREQELTEEVQVLSFNGLNIGVVFSFRYRPDEPILPLLHQNLGPNYVDKVVRPVLISAVCEVIGNYRPEELYTTHSATIQEEIQRVCERDIEEHHIKFSQVLIKDINLPEKVTQAIEEKLTLQQQAEGYDFRLISEERERIRKTVESEGIRQYNMTIAEALTPALLQYLQIDAMRALSLSDNSKVVVLGGDPKQTLSMPLMLDDLRSKPARANLSTGRAGEQGGEMTERAGGLSPADGPKRLEGLNTASAPEGAAPNVGKESGSTGAPSSTKSSSGPGSSGPGSSSPSSSSPGSSSPGSSNKSGTSASGSNNSSRDTSINGRTAPASATTSSPRASETRSERPSGTSRTPNTREERPPQSNEGANAHESTCPQGAAGALGAAGSELGRIFFPAVAKAQPAFRASATSAGESAGLTHQR
ncbi:MAG: prohibitin family protein [Myxococcota bacterium]